MDLRGHGRGIGTNGHPFTLDDCVGDVAALAYQLRMDRFIAVGYSMGGVIAQLLWKDHPELVEGLVLCATSRNFRGDPREKILFAIYPAAAFFVRVAAPELARAAGKLLGAPGARTAWREWIRSEIALARPRAVTQAAREIARFSSHDWVSRIDVPTAVVVTARDRLVPPRRQRKLAGAIPHAEIFEVEGDHFVCTENPPPFLEALEEACGSVVARIPRWNGPRRKVA